MEIQTVLGAIDSAELGEVLMHEHLTFADRTLREVFGQDFFEQEVVTQSCVKQFNAAKDCGITTVVDGTPINLGRDVRLLQAVAQKTGLNFIASTGFYYPQEIYLDYASIEQIHDFLYKECTIGLEGAGIKPGILKAACGEYGITPTLQKVYRATGQVSAETKLPIFCHHEVQSQNGQQLLDIFEQAGAAPEQIIMGHAGDSNDLDYLEALLKRGCYLGMDRFGYSDFLNSIENRVQTIIALCALGYRDRLLLSHDLAVYSGCGESWAEFAARSKTMPPVTYDFIHRRVIPALRAGGLTEADITHMLKDNPRRFFEGK